MDNIQTDKNKYLLDADVYRLLNLGFSYPDTKTIEKINDIASGLIEQNKIDLGLMEILKKLVPEIDEDIIRAEYSRVFIKGGLPITESNITARYNTVSDVSAFYAAFGFSPKSGETPDSIMYELEFLALMALKIAIAPNKEAMEITEDAYNKFLGDHFLEFAEKFAFRLNDGDAIPYYKILTELLLDHLSFNAKVSS